ncbi:hypothetical protein [Rhizobium johnstonii]|uniref:hypothetical protein n=1 Tax=Rhizobium johnstonii TaxID=3019933 RepID=UPI003F99027A
MALPPFASGFAPFMRNNSDTLLAAGAGLLGGQTAPQQVAGLAQGVAGARQKNKTLEFLRQQNPELAAAVESGALSGGDAYKLFYQQKLEAEKPKNNFMSAGGSIYDTSTGQWITPPQGAGNDAEYGLQPVYGTDPKTGKTVLGQISKGGTFKVLDTGDNFNVSTGTGTVDLGTTIGTIDRRTGQLVSQTPKDLAGAESQKAIGSAQGQAIAAAPGDLQAGMNAKDLITQLKTDPNRERGTGWSAAGNVIPGTAGYDYQNKVDQAKSGAFLTAIQQMRGLGSLSNAEGGAATAAVTRMNTATSEGAFNAALDDYEKIIDQGIARAQAKIQQSGGQVQPPPGIAPPAAPGTVRRYNPATGRIE